MRVRPDTIVTFGGMTGHTDHQAGSAWTTAAWEELGGAVARLGYVTLTPAFHARWGSLNDEVRLWAYGRPPCTDVSLLAHVLELSGEALDRKIAALRAHGSQIQALVDHVGEATFRGCWSTGAFVDASTVRTSRRLPQPA